MIRIRKVIRGVLSVGLLLAVVGLPMNPAKGVELSPQLSPQMEEKLAQFAPGDREIIRELIVANLELGQTSEKLAEMLLVDGLLARSPDERHLMIQELYKYFAPPYSNHEDYCLLVDFIPPEAMAQIKEQGLDIDEILEMIKPYIGPIIMEKGIPFTIASVFTISAPFTGYWGMLMSVGAPPIISFVGDWALGAGGLLGVVAEEFGIDVGLLLSKFTLGSVIFDNRDDPVIAISQFEACKGVKPHPPLILLNWGPDSAAATAPFLEEYKMCNATTGSVCARTNYLLGKNNVGIQACHEEMNLDAIRYLVTERPKEVGGEPPQKIGAIITTTPFMRTAVEMTQNSTFFKQMEEEYGLEWVGTETMSLTAPDVSTQLVKLRNKGADVIVLMTPTQSTAVVAKCAKLLGMGPNRDYKCDFVVSSYMLDWAVMDIAGRDAIEGWYTSYAGNSYDEPGARGTFWYKFTEDFTGVRLTMPSAHSVGGGMTVVEIMADVLIHAVMSAFMDPLLEMIPPGGIEAIEDVGAFIEEAYDKCMEIFDEFNADFIIKRIIGWNNHWGGFFPLRPYTMIPGKWTVVDNLICVERKGYARHVKHADGKMWSWVPPKIIPEDGPQPPEGWIVPPLEGSIDYGKPWGEWTFEDFLAEYDVPLWWAIHAYAFGPDNRLDKDLLFKTLDRYFECKKTVVAKEYETSFAEVDWSNPEKRVEKLTEFKETYYLPDHWVEWIDEYIEACEA